MTTRPPLPPLSRETAIQKVRLRKTVGILAIRTNARAPIQADPYLLGKINHAGNHLTY
jgi:nuclear transport factor 2 (NTF2) superfamily protein